jgi:hypothetical protein
MAMLLGGFGLIAIRVGAEAVFGPIWGHWHWGAASALPEVVPPVAAIVIGVAALVVAWWLARGYKRSLDEGD